MYHILFDRYRYLLLLACCLAASSCTVRPETLPTDVGVYNYTTAAIVRFSVSSLDGRSSSGGPSIDPKEEDAPYIGGHEFMCCMGGIPTEWRPGLWIKVVWLRDQHPYSHENRTGLKWFQATAEIPPYKRPTDFFVKFLPGDRIRLYIPSNSPLPDGTYEEPSIKPAEDDPYIVQGIPDVKRNADLAKELAWRVQRDRERADKERARKASGNQEEGGKP